MAKLRDLITESKFLKREFGEPLPTFKGVMKQHQVNKLKEDWWDDMSPEDQASYIKKHPGSKQAQDAGGDEPEKITKGPGGYGDRGNVRGGDQRNFGEPDDEEYFKSMMGGGEPEDKPHGGDTGKDADSGAGSSLDQSNWDEAESAIDDLQYGGRLSDSPDLTYHVDDVVDALQSGTISDEDVDKARELSDKLDSMGMTNDEDPESFEDLGFALQTAIDQWEENADDRHQESITINGQKYRPIKESKQRTFKEIYDRTFRSLK